MTSTAETFTPDQEDSVVNNAPNPIEHIVRRANMPTEVALKAIELTKKHGVKIDQFKNNGDGTIWVRVVNMEDKGKGEAFDAELGAFWKEWQQGSKQEAGADRLAAQEGFELRAFYNERAATARTLATEWNLAMKDILEPGSNAVRGVDVNVPQDRVQEFLTAVDRRTQEGQAT